MNYIIYIYRFKACSISANILLVNIYESMKCTEPSSLQVKCPQHLPTRTPC